ncbi:MAG: DUF1641 domain-containing protein [Planctomycetaceae bacterium]|nr:DUF1641 domain-containing protein [Planctomycetaceae bacterium]
METTLERPSLTDRLNDPQTAEVLHRLLDHAESLDQMLTTAGQIPNLLAIAVDFFDAVCRRASHDGIDVEQRATGLMQLLLKVTEPATLQAMQTLLARLPQLADNTALLEQLPGLLAIAMDAFDEWARDLKQDGIHLEDSLRNGLYAALYLGGKLHREELDRIGFLLKSDVLSENSVSIVSMAGTALSSCHQGTCEHPVPQRVGLLGMLRAMRDPNTQRALSFAMQFAKCFGGVVGSHPENQLCSTPSSSEKG